MTVYKKIGAEICVLRARIIEGEVNSLDVGQWPVAVNKVYEKNLEIQYQI